MQNFVECHSIMNDDTIALYLEVFCHFHNYTFFCPHFLPLFHSDGWLHVKRFFTMNTHVKPRTTFHPKVIGDPVIAIPCFINNNHWRGFVRR
jgi:hypothetical protein